MPFAIVRCPASLVNAIRLAVEIRFGIPSTAAPMRVFAPPFRRSGS